MVIDLAGAWDVVLDHVDEGIKSEWFHSLLNNTTQVILPGSLNEHGVGDVPSLDTEWTGSIYDRSWYHDPNLEVFRKAKPPHFPFWLTPAHYYVGIAWYQKELLIPQEMDGIPFELFFERVHWQSRVWINDVCIGSSNSLSVPHRFQCKGLPVGTHRLTVRIDNRIGEINPGPDAHSISDHTQGNWNGMIGSLELRYLNKKAVRFGTIRYESEYRSGDVLVFGTILSDSAIEGALRIRFSRNFDDAPVLQTRTSPLYSEQQELNFSTCLNVSDVRSWDEFDPELYRIEIVFTDVDGFVCSQTERIGFRDFGTEGTQFTINGRRLFLRGNVDCCVFPLTGYPPVDKESWINVLRIQKEMGINHVRFHSWCPPRSAFEVADELGLYLQVEAPVWPNHGSSVGDGEPIDRYIYDESERILHEYGNHPSFVMFAGGNEPFGDHQVGYLRQFAQHWKKEDARRLYTGASVGTEWPIVTGTDFIVHSRPRGLPWDDRPHSLFDYSEQIDGFKVPFVAHEMGQFCVFPDFEEISRYTGVYRAKNLEMFRSLFNRNFPQERASFFFEVSGKLQLLCYKAEIEAALRTPGFAGIQLLGVNDFPGQGTALIGWLNAFYAPKPYVDMKLVRQFLGETVLLAKFEKFVFTRGESIAIIPGIAHFGAHPIAGQKIKWRLLNDEQTLRTGEIECEDISTGYYKEFSELVLETHLFDEAVQLDFELRVGEFSNSWKLWVYPTQNETDYPGNIVVLDHCGKDFDRAIEEGRDIFLMASESIQNGSDVVQYLRPAFWNTSWFQMAPPHTLGLIIEDQHPLFQNFPTSFHSDYQWWEIIDKQSVANLELFPEDYQPIVAPIDTWFFNRKLAMVFEMRCQKSRIFVCTMDLLSSLKDRPVARHFLECIKTYLGSDSFDPLHVVDVEIVKELFEVKDRPSYDCMTDEKPDELIPGKHQ